MNISNQKDDDMDYDPVRETRGVDCATASVMILLCAALTLWGFYELVIWAFGL